MWVTLQPIVWGINMYLVEKILIIYNKCLEKNILCICIVQLLREEPALEKSASIDRGSIEKSITVTTFIQHKWVSYEGMCILYRKCHIYDV